MNALVVYESMFGNTRAVAEEIGAGLATRYNVRVIPAGDARPEDLAAPMLLVAGGPTHGWGMSRPSSRANAATQAAKAGSPLTLEPGAAGPGLREWLSGEAAGGPGSAGAAAAFDTRVAMPRFLTGAAGPKIVKLLRRAGRRLVAGPESFLVDRKNVLLPGERERARAWGERLAGTAAPAQRTR